MDLWEIQEDFLLELNSKSEQSLVKYNKDKNLTNDFQINRSLVNSKEYHDKFKDLNLPRRVQECVYREAGRLLDHVNGNPEEYLIAINARTGDTIVDNLDRNGDIYHTGFIGSELSEYDKCLDPVILMHNHSYNGRPSGQDLLSFLHQEKVDLSLIICHDGTVHAIEYVSPKFEEFYLNEFEKERNLYCDIIEAKRLAMTKAIKFNELCREKYKLFKIRRL